MGAFTSRAGVVSASVQPSAVDVSEAPSELPLQSEESYVEIEIFDNGKYFTRKSLLVFDSSTKFRRKVIWLAEWVWFDRFILMLILLNSL
jgi:hypothetical protein